MNVSGGGGGAGGGGAGAGGESGGSAGMVIGAGVPMTEKEKKKAKKLQQQQLEHAPLAAPEDDSEEYEDEAGYEQINDAFSDAVNNVASQLFTFSSGGAGRAPDGGPAGVPTGHDLMTTNKNKLRQRREKEQSELLTEKPNRPAAVTHRLLIPKQFDSFQHSRVLRLRE